MEPLASASASRQMQRRHSWEAGSLCLPESPSSFGFPLPMNTDLTKLKPAGNSLGAGTHKPPEKLDRRGPGYTGHSQGMGGTWVGQIQMLPFPAVRPSATHSPL